MPAEQIPGVSGSNGVAAQSVSPSHTNDPFLYNTNYILLVMKYTNVAMEHQANLVAMQGQLENVVTQIQGCLSTISEFFSTLQANAASGGGWADGKFFSPDANSGLNNSFYHMNENSANGGIGVDNASGDVSQSYKGSMANFLTAINQLFNYSSSGTGPTLNQVMNINIPDGSGNQFSMQNYYTHLQSEFNTTYGGALRPVISGDDSSGVGAAGGMHVSLLQQYMYYQAQLTVNTDPLSQVESAWTSGGSANGINGLIDFDPESSGCDPNVTSLIQILNDLNATITVSRTGDDWVNGQDISSSKYTNNVTSNLLQMIGENNRDPGSDLYNESTGCSTPVYDPGLYAAFSYAAFNYIWTKNPTMATATSSTSNDPTEPPGDWKWNSATGSTTNGDVLSDLYSNTSSSQTSLSSSGSQANSQFQEQVNGVQQEQNVAQNMISGWASAMTSVVGNWKSA